MKKTGLVVATVIVILGAIGCTQVTPRSAEPQGVAGGPRFIIDPFWPKPLRENWIFTQIAGLAVDSRDHVWVLHRPNTILDDEKGTKSALPTLRWSSRKVRGQQQPHAVGTSG